MEKEEEAAGRRDESKEKTSSKKSLQVACQQCRRRKARCNGDRPTCAHCHKKGELCRYEAQEGESRVAALRRENETLQIRVAELEALQLETDSSRSSISGASYRTRETVVTPTTARTTPDSGSSPPLGDAAAAQSAAILRTMSTATDQEASMLLAKLRTGHSWEELVDEVGDGKHRSTHQTALSGTTTSTSKSSIQASAEVPDIAMLDYDESQPTHRKPSALHLSIGESLSRTRHLSWQRDSHRLLESGRQINISSNIYNHMPGASAAQRANYPGGSSATFGESCPVPTWSIMSMVENGVHDAFEAAFQEARAEIESGQSVHAYFGSHVWLEALHNEYIYASAPRLSQIVVNVIRSVQPEEGFDRMTGYGIMWLYWNHFRWILHASPETYDELPMLLWPTPSQIFAPHPRTLDFILSPGLRNYLLDTRKHDSVLLVEAVKSAACNWSGTLDEAVVHNGRTGEIHLSSRFKAHVSRPDAWIVGKERLSHLLPDIGIFLATPAPGE